MWERTRGDGGPCEQRFGRESAIHILRSAHGSCNPGVGSPLNVRRHWRTAWPENKRPSREGKCGASEDFRGRRDVVRYAFWKSPSVSTVTTTHMNAGMCVCPRTCVHAQI